MEAKEYLTKKIIAELQKLAVDTKELNSVMTTTQHLHRLKSSLTLTKLGLAQCRMVYEFPSENPESDLDKLMSLYESIVSIRTITMVEKTTHPLRTNGELP